MICPPREHLSQLWQSIQGLRELLKPAQKRAIVALDMHANENFDPVQAAKRLLREAGTGALGTLGADGAPYVSLVTVATQPDGAPVLLLSKLARHTENIGRDARISLLLAAAVRAGDPLAKARISITGRIEKTEDFAAKRRFLARHPTAASYAGFADFGFYRIEIEHAHLVAGFGRIVDLSRAELLTSLNGAEKLLEAEEGAVAHMNEDHLDAIELYATRLLGEAGGAWKIASLDPEGCDLLLGETARRLEFPQRVTAGDELRKTMVSLVKQARSCGLMA
jgi:putative heme iron utilization protein